MRDSGYVWLPEYEPRKAFGHRSSGRMMERRRPAVATMATLHTTPADYARFVIATMRESVAMVAPQTAVDKDIAWGFGWGLERTSRGTAFWHHGENWGEFQNLVLAYPDGDGVVIFTNSGNGFSIMPEIVSGVLGGTHPVFAWMGYDHYDAPVKMLLRDLRARGAEAALGEPVVNTLTESQINRLGYELLETNRTADAVHVFARNVARFPQSLNVYDSLAEAVATGARRLRWP